MIEDRQMPTPHWSSRRGASILYLVFHCDASPKESITDGWLNHPDAEASYHVHGRRDGTSTRYVKDADNAWHCGKSAWKGRTALNRVSLGYSFANRGDGKELLTPEQIATAKEWSHYWQAQYDIQELLTHKMIAPTRRKDPDVIPNFRLEDYR
jgi:N-acetylmuramoyl-L-alanine amidase